MKDHNCRKRNFCMIQSSISFRSTQNKLEYGRRCSIQARAPSHQMAQTAPRAINEHGRENSSASHLSRANCKEYRTSPTPTIDSCYLTLVNVSQLLASGILPSRPCSVSAMMHGFDKKASKAVERRGVSPVIQKAHRRISRKYTAFGPF